MGEILWRQDWYVVRRFKEAVADRGRFAAGAHVDELMKRGQSALQAGDIERLREVVSQLRSFRVGSAGREDDMLRAPNILRG
jgi:hypothetical protein